MRTRYLRSGLAAGMLLAGGLASTGCDDVTAGQLMEDPAPPKLVKLLVQDETARGGRSIGTDLLDQTPPTSCDDSHPCTTAGDLGYPNPACLVPDGKTSGLCPDQLSDTCSTPNFGDYFGQLNIGATYDSCGAATSGPRPVYLGTPIIGGGNSIRLVFSKLLDPSIESTMTDPMTGAITYALAAGAVELDGPDGKPVALIPNDPSTGGGAFYDAGGSPLSTSDPIGVPFGPAIVIKPAARFAPNSQYSIKVDPTKIVDHQKQQVSNIDGSMPFQFTTEGLNLIVSTPDLTIPMAKVLQNDVIQLVLSSDVDLNSGTVSLACGGTPVMLQVWKDLGTDPTACSPAEGVIDIVAVTAPGSPVDLPLNMVCTLAVANLKDTSLGKSTFGASYVFTVKGPKDPADTAAVANFILPQQCQNTPGVDGGTSD